MLEIGNDALPNLSVRFKTRTATLHRHGRKTNRADALLLRLDGYAQASLPDGKILRVEDASLAVWTGWSRHAEGENMALFYLSAGNIDSKNPDEEIRRKMWRIAQRLNARVQGDDGEFYDEIGNGAYEELEPMRPGESPFELPALPDAESKAPSSPLVEIPKDALKPSARAPNRGYWLARLLSSLFRRS